MSNAPSGKGRGCFFYGCLTLVILLVVGSLGLYFGTRYLIQRWVVQYTSPTPMTLPRVEGTPEAISAVQDRFKAFAEALKAGRPVEPLSLSERELNLLINHAPQARDLKDHLHVAIVDNKLRGTLSLPLDNLGFRSLKGRYLNGVAEIKPTLENGVLLVTLETFEVAGRRLPEQAMAALRTQNLAKDLYKETATVELLKKLESVVVADGRLLVRPRTTGGP